MQITNYDSDFCGSLPIHLTNLIQPYGVLLVVDAATEAIIQASENIDQVFGENVSQLLDTRLNEQLTADDYSALKKKLSNDFNDKVPALWEINGKHRLVLVHRKPEYLIIEIDISPLSYRKQDTFVEVYQELKYAMSAIEGTRTLEETCRLAVEELRRISGFDKVMIYSFDSDWNGTVIAEARDESMESYLGLTFPASDIPRPARELYRKNSYRFIPDREYKPVKLYPVINPITNSFIDLSDCNLRSVAAVHLEYLKNMGVTASMSTRILQHDNLWGLIACHHKTPKHMTYEMCSVFEMLSSIISIKISSVYNLEDHEVAQDIASTYSRLRETVYRSGKLDNALLDNHGGVLKLFQATGAAISRRGSFQTIGQVPSYDQLADLVLWLHTRELKKPWYSESLSTDYEYASEYKDVASGLLVIPINSTKDEYLLIFRPEVEKVINWGGNPEERIQFGKDKKNYHPRNSFTQWQQKVNSISLPWKKEQLNIADILRSFIYEFETSVIA